MRILKTLILVIVCLPLFALGDLYAGNLIGADTGLSGFHRWFVNTTAVAGRELGFHVVTTAMMVALQAASAVVVLVGVFSRIAWTSGLSEAGRRSAMFVAWLVLFGGIGAFFAPFTLGVSVVHSVAGVVLVIAAMALGASFDGHFVRET